MRPAVLDFFKSKKAAIECFREIRSRYLDGRDLDGVDLEMMLHVLSYHPSAARKIGPGVAAIFTAPDRAGYGTVGFWVRRVDGTIDDFSWNECLNGSSRIVKVRDAAREAIRYQIAAFRSSHADDACNACGSRESLAVDHVWPFSALLDAWLEPRGGDVETRWATASEGVGERFRHDSDAREWADYHRAHATLQILCGSCNSRKGAR